MSLEQKLTPGVYIEEKNAFPNSVVQVETAIPAFIGYTGKAEYNGQTLSGKATKIGSMSDFINFFGGMPPVKFTIVEDKSTPAARSSVSLLSKNYAIRPKVGTLFYLYNSIRLFYQNGGGACYIVSVGDYSKAPEYAPLLAGMDALKYEPEATMVSIPDGLLLDAKEYYQLTRDMVQHCADMQSRIAILDVYDGATEDVKDLAVPGNVIDRFRAGIGDSELKYGVAYYPWLKTRIVQDGELTFTHFDDLSAYFEPEVTDPAAAILGKYKSADPSAKAIVEIQTHNALLALSKNYTSIIKAAVAVLNILPPGAAMAGVYAYVDSTIGVWKAPANVSLNAVIAPTVNLHDEEQASLNVDAVGGKSVNVIRAFTGMGVLVWGARTLDGNSNDWRYVNVRRTLMMIEQSVKLAARAYVFEPNVANTWVTVKAVISNFLSDVWKQGGLVGSKAEDAYSVKVDLGSTMTANDILDGIMRVTVMVAIAHPAEFIEISFQQQMQKS